MTNPGPDQLINLELCELSAGYGSRRVIENMTMNLYAEEGGKVVGLLGPKASGKSTLIKTIAGVKSPRGGSINLHINGK